MTAADHDHIRELNTDIALAHSELAYIASGRINTEMALIYSNSMAFIQLETKSYL